MAEYEIVTLNEKKAAGLKIRTNNSSPDMGEKIGGLWEKFFTKGIYAQIPGKINEKTIGLYTNYESNEKGDYDMFVCCEVQKETQQPKDLEITTIEAGKYAKFIVKGNMVTAVHDFWLKLWNMNLDRKYGSDFEEYQPGCDMDNCEIHMYISLK